MKATLPHLSLEGFITNKNVIMLKIYEHFLASDYSQSNIFLGKIGSLKFLLNEYKGVDELKRNVEITLNRMYSKYFQSVDVMCEIIDVDTSSEQIIKVDIAATDFDGKKYSLSKSVTEIDGKIKNFDVLEAEMHEGE